MSKQKNSEKDILANVFRDRLKDYKLPVEDNAWEKIEKDLPAPPSSTIPLFWKCIGVAASIALILGLGILLTWEKDINKQTTVEVRNHETIERKEKPDLLASVTDNMAEKNTERKNQEKSIIKEEKKVEKGEEKIKSGKEEGKEEIIQIVAEPEVKPKDEANKKTIENEQDTKVKNNYLGEIADTSPDEWDLPSNTTREKNINKGLSLALAVGNSGNTLPESSNLYAHEKVFSSPIMDSNLGYWYYADIQEESNTQRNYNIPISLGLSIRKHFSEKWAIESGLTYTYLSSTENTYGRVNSTSDIKLNYIGIPIKMVYNVYNNKRLSIYLAGGGMGEKCVYGQQQTSLYSQQTTAKLDIKEIQWSVFGNVGLNFRLIDHLGLFVEPGVSYYFDDKSDVMTIRKDTPLSIDLRGGIRLTY